MSKELLLVAEALSNAKGVHRDVVLQAIQLALESATRKFSDKDINVRVQLDSKTGEYKTFRFWEVVSDENLEFPEKQIVLSKAKEYVPRVELGGIIEELMPCVKFGRIAAQTAKQIIIQKVREAERKQIIDQFSDKLGQLVYGTVKKVTRDSIIVDLGGKAEAYMSRNEILPNEVFRPNDKVRAYLYDIVSQIRGPQLFVSRTRDGMLIELFKIEVPEIGENIITIKASAREPGNRSKIAVKTNDGRIDPVGACVGMRGSRVQAISSELSGERVDIILWDDNPAQLVINAMAPAEVTSIVVDEDAHSMDLAVKKEQLSQAIGRNGQNVKLASQLTGWSLNVMTIEDFNNKGKEESNTIVNFFMSNLCINEKIARLLVDHGFSLLEEIAYLPKEELLVISGLNEEIVDNLKKHAHNVLLTKALASEEFKECSKENKVLSSELLGMQGMTKEIANYLLSIGITTMDKLAECSVDELFNLKNGMTEKKAADLIMQARKSWFE
ncbi:transcription termination factor NusA [Candidatus Legionella polyplacis]|uniref:Transcription termination/antitermination protein NusA n=1 Tax=Candidatus Legionella polyplacis TaxID=2005262 RepID=A0ABZ2GXP1_9GAMM